jgi:hypothetical protein
MWSILYLGKIQSIQHRSGSKYSDNVYIVVMAKNKTAETANSVTNFINQVGEENKRKDSFHLIELYKTITGFEPKMWGPSIVGFGSYHYKYASGHEGDAPMAGFSPRKSSLVIYVTESFDNRVELLSQLGKHTSSKVCLYVKKLSDINLDILEKIIRTAFLNYQTGC